MGDGFLFVLTSRSIGDLLAPLNAEELAAVSIALRK
jgi:hypothetical protein